MKMCRALRRIRELAPVKDITRYRIRVLDLLTMGTLKVYGQSLWYHKRSWKIAHHLLLCAGFRAVKFKRQ